MPKLTEEKIAELRARLRKPYSHIGVDDWNEVMRSLPDLISDLEEARREKDGYKSAAERIEDLRRRETADHEAELLLIWRTAMPIKVLAEGKQPCPVVLIDRIVKLLRYEERCGADKGGNRP